MNVLLAVRTQGEHRSLVLFELQGTTMRRLRLPLPALQILQQDLHPPPNDEATARAIALLGHYSTFQQLSFAPHFPLASIADDYTIPPTYLAFVDYQKLYEKPVDTVLESSPASMPTSPDPRGSAPSADVPDVPSVPEHPTKASSSFLEEPSRWVYQDPKGILRGKMSTQLVNTIPSNTFFLFRTLGFRDNAELVT